MKKPIVYFTNLRTTSGRSLGDKLGELLAKLGLGEGGIYKKGEIIALKLHFGEKGNASFIRPVFVRRGVDAVRAGGAEVFLTDTNTLYAGSRINSASHLRTAITNGFDYAVVDAPLIIADGLRGESSVDIEVDGKHLKEVSIGQEIVSADGLVVFSHFKCHELTGFGGALKNMGMGCASRSGKLVQHSTCAPVVNQETCTACGVCVPSCQVDAIEIGQAAFIDDKICTGCGFCIAVCPEKAIDVSWNEETGAIQEKMMQHVEGVMKGKEGKTVFINFITQVSPNCDCYGHNDAPIVGDIGIMASTDPIAIDQASADMVNAQPGLEGTALETGHEAGADKFRGVHPTIDWTVQLAYGEELGIGQRDYELCEI